MKFSKYNNPNRKRIRKQHTPKNQYIPTWEELQYAKSVKITPQEYVDLKYTK